MNPNPYRMTLLVVGVIGCGLGALLFAAGQASPVASGDAALAAVGLWSCSTGAVLLVVWVAVSAVIFGLRPPAGTKPE